MKNAAYIGGLLGLALLVILVVRADFSAMLHTLNSGGWRLLWLVPYRSLFFFLYAAGWLILLRPYDPTHRAGLGYDAPQKLDSNTNHRSPLIPLVFLLVLIAIPFVGWFAAR